MRELRGDAIAQTAGNGRRVAVALREVAGDRLCEAALAVRREPAWIITSRPFQPMPSSPAISSRSPIASARAAGSTGKITPGASRATSATIADQLDRAGSSPCSTTGTLSMPVHAATSASRPLTRTATTGICAIRNKPFTASDHGLGTTAGTTTRIPVAAFAAATSTNSIMRGTYQPACNAVTSRAHMAFVPLVPIGDALATLVDERTAADPRRAGVLEDTLRARRAEVHAGWGPVYVDRVHKKGKLTARERLAKLVDAGTRPFEVGTFVNYGEMFPGDQKSPPPAWSPRSRGSRAAGAW